MVLSPRAPRKACVYVRSRLGIVQPTESEVRLGPDRRAMLSAGHHHAARQAGAAVRNNVVGGLFAGGMGPGRTDRDEFLRLLRQEQLEEALLASVVEVGSGNVCEQPQLVLLVAGGAVSVAGRKQGHTAADWPQYCCELLQLRSEFGKASATALQAG